ncbi:hypothetical protein B0H11DRAFT_1931942 [Mycena galericulata]|nr:hypothetical protein B0H11DRAFT_1931942 [Mycena galericulata]
MRPAAIPNLRSTLIPRQKPKLTFLAKPPSFHSTRLAASIDEKNGSGTRLFSRRTGPNAESHYQLTINGTRPTGVRSGHQPQQNPRHTGAEGTKHHAVGPRGERKAPRSGPSGERQGGSAGVSPAQDVTER